jgi:hypothetical protein
MPLIDQRRKTKERHERYRTAARRLYPNASIREQCAVNEDAEGTGAFIEVVVWIPREEIAPREVCILECDSPSYPPEKDEHRQCGCQSCLDHLAKL